MWSRPASTLGNWWRLLWSEQVRKNSVVIKIDLKTVKHCYSTCSCRLQYWERPACPLHPLPQTHGLQAVPRRLPVPPVSGGGGRDRLPVHRHPQHHEQCTAASKNLKYLNLLRSVDDGFSISYRFLLDPSSSSLWTSSPSPCPRPYRQPWQLVSCTHSGAWSGSASFASVPRGSTCAVNWTWFALTR